MARLGWTQLVFIACFLLFGVGIPLVWPSQELWAALLKLGVGTALGTGLWLGVVYLVVRLRR